MLLCTCRRALPGIALCFVVASVAIGAADIEMLLFGRSWIDAVVLAIVVGLIARALWLPPQIFRAGIGVSQKLLIEVAVVLFGLSISVGTLVRAGPFLMLGMAVTVILGIGAGYAIGRVFGLSHTLAMLIACGNAICGNTAIVAIAPTIEAPGDDIAASIGFTALLGIVVVLVLPPTAAMIGLNQMQSGTLAGLTVYSVSQIVAATAPIGPLAIQIGILVKLARMLMLGPVILALSLTSYRAGDPSPIRLRAFAPWFIIGFLAMIGVRSTDLVPALAIAIAAKTAGLLIIVSMAALGLTVDLQVIAKAGARVTSVVTLSLAALSILSLLVVLIAVR